MNTLILSLILLGSYPPSTEAEKERMAAKREEIKLKEEAKREYYRNLNEQRQRIGEERRYMRAVAQSSARQTRIANGWANGSIMNGYSGYYGNSGYSNYNNYYNSYNSDEYRARQQLYNLYNNGSYYHR